MTYRIEITFPTSPLNPQNKQLHPTKFNTRGAAQEYLEEFTKNRPELKITMEVIQHDDKDSSERV